MKVEVDVLGSPSLIVRTVSGREATLDTASELRSCVKAEVDVLGSPSLIVRTVSMGMKQHWTQRQSSGAV